MKTILQREKSRQDGQKVKEVKGYNSKIISAGKDWREEVLKHDQFYLGFILQSIWL